MKMNFYYRLLKYVSQGMTPEEASFEIGKEDVKTIYRGKKK